MASYAHILVNNIVACHILTGELVNSFNLFVSHGVAEDFVYISKKGNTENNLVVQLITVNSLFEARLCASHVLIRRMLRMGLRVILSSLCRGRNEDFFISPAFSPSVQQYPTLIFC